MWPPPSYAITTKYEWITSIPFQQTSDEPYDRHDYKIVLKNGKSITFDDYEIVNAFWWNNNQMRNLDYIEVLDKPKPKPQGFNA